MRTAGEDQAEREFLAHDSSTSASRGQSRSGVSSGMQIMFGASLAIAAAAGHRGFHAAGDEPVRAVAGDPGAGIRGDARPAQRGGQVQRAGVVARSSRRRPRAAPRSWGSVVRPVKSRAGRRSVAHHFRDNAVSSPVPTKKPRRRAGGYSRELREMAAAASASSPFAPTATATTAAAAPQLRARPSSHLAQRHVECFGPVAGAERLGDSPVAIDGVDAVGVGNANPSV